MGYKSKADRLANQRLHYRRRRAKAIEFMGGVCVGCGSTEDLEFDHIDPKNKSYTISSRLTHNWESVKLELVKCQLLCKICHQAKTIKESVLTHVSWNKGLWKHGTETGYRNGCRCEPCKTNYSAIRRNKYQRLKT